LGSYQSKEMIVARGHANILATHKTTFEITKETCLSKSGDCIIAVGADKGMNALGLQFRENLRKDNAEVTILVEAGGVVDVINAHGNSKLILDHPTDIVIRKSGYICRRTLAIHADKSAKELSRALTKNLREPEEKVRLTLIVKSQRTQTSKTACHS
jgi:hypothetical protein